MDDVLLIAGGQEISGWNSVRVTLGMERCPNDFEITMTERFPGELGPAVINSGDMCELFLSNKLNNFDRVITGYVDRVDRELSANVHTVTVAGRGKCADLVDCSATWAGSQIVNSTAFDIALKLASQYGIAVTLKNVDPLVLSDGSVDGRGSLPRIPQLMLSYGETIYNTLEQVCRYSGLLVYEGPDGNLILGRVAQQSNSKFQISIGADGNFTFKPAHDKHNTGFQEGRNVESAKVLHTMDQRYSKYVVRMMGVNTLGDTGNGGDILKTVIDKNVPRHRVKCIVAENGDAGGDVAKQRGVWEMKRRWGRSFQIFIETDSWRDGDGKLWTPNTLVDVELPTLKVPSGLNWIISEVAFERNERGTHAKLVLMPPEAFTVEPTVPSWEKGVADVSK